MALNVIWVAFFLVGILVALAKLLFWQDATFFADMTAMLLGGELTNGDKTDGMARVAASISLGR